MKHPQLAAQPRTVLGKKVSRLRRQGLIPANIYGFGGEPTPIQVEEKQLERLMHHTTGSTLTFIKATDSIVVDGNDQIRTQTKGGNGKCSS